MSSLTVNLSVLSEFFFFQGKKYVFVANSDNLGAVVDLSILSMFFYFLCLWLHVVKVYVIYNVVCLNSFNRNLESSYQKQ